MLKVGNIYTSKNYGIYEIIDIKGKKDDKVCTVRFRDTGYECTVCRHSAASGKIKDVLKPTVLGIGYLGKSYAHDTPTTLLKSKAYSTWKNMLSRCYYTGDASYTKYGAKGVTVCARWHSLTNFLEDLQKLPGYIEAKYLNGELALDKDKLAKGPNKVYAPDTCCLLSIYENSTMGAFLKNKKCIAIKGIFEKEYVSITQCSLDLGISQSAISNVLTGKQRTTKGYTFKYA